MRYSHIALLSVAGQLTSLGFAFVFHFLVARWLGVALYGDLGILLGTFTLLLFPIISVQAVLMREVAQLDQENKTEQIAWLITNSLKNGFAAGCILVPLALVVLYSLGFLLHPLETLFILLSVPFFYALFIFNSYLQGRQQVLQFASLLVLIDLFRLLLAAVLVPAGSQLLGVGIAYILTAVLLSAGVFLLFRSRLYLKPAPFSFSLFSHLRWVFPTYVLLSTFLVIDLFFVRSLGGAEPAGLYNAALTLARAVFYAGIGLMSAFLPQSSRLQIQQDGARIIRSLAFSVGLLFLFASTLYLLKDILLTVLYGETYRSAAPLLGILAFSMFFLASSLLFVNLMWSQREQKIPLFIATLVAAVSLVLFYFFTLSFGAIGAAYASLASTLLLALLTAVGGWWVCHRAKTVSRNTNF